MTKFKEKSYLLHMTQEEFDMVKEVAEKTRRTFKDTILYSVEQEHKHIKGENCECTGEN